MLKGNRCLANLRGPFGLAPTSARHATAVSGLFAGRREDIPEAQRLVGGGGQDRAAIGTNGHVQDASRVTFELFDLGHGGVLPQRKLIASVTVRRENFLLVRVPLKSTDLRTSVDRVEQGASLRAPELDGAISGSTTRG